MRLYADQIKQGILHPDKRVREAAVRYFTQSFSQDRAVLPLIIQAIEQYGWEQALTYYHYLYRLPHTSETFHWTTEELHLLSESEPLQQYRQPLHYLLAYANMDILSQHYAAAEAATADEPRFQSQIRRRIELLDADVETCWQKLVKFSEVHQSVDYAEQADTSYSDDLIEAIARHGVDESRILKILSEEIEEYEDNPLYWMVGFMAALAGELRLESAIPLILDKLLIDEEIDWLASICEDSLLQMGSDAVVRAIAERYDDADFFARMTLGYLLKNLHSELSLKTCLDLLAIEEDLELQSILGQALLAQFASEGVEPVYEMIQAEMTDPQVADLRSDLLAVTTLLEIEIPERQQWQEELEAKELRIQEMLKGEREFDYQEVFGPNPYGNEYDPGVWDDEGDILDDEDSYFEDEENPFYQEDSEPLEPAARVTKASTVGRNEPCPCGSGKKYKKCCLHKQGQEGIDTN